MKKTLILAAVAAIAAVGCTKTYHQVDPATQGPAIGFGTWTETLTKAHDPGATTNFAVGDNFNVYGTKLVESTPSDVFTGTVVTKTALSPETWTYSPTRFWDPNATSYTFYAVAPAGLLDGTNASATTAGAFTSEPIEFLGGDSNKSDIKDILVAAKTTVTKTGDPAAFISPVNLPFHHIASLVDLKVQKHNDLELTGEDENNYIKVAVTAISLTNIDGNGHFTVSTYGDSSPFAPVTSASTWTEETGAAKKTYNHTSGYETVTLPTDVNAVSATSPNALITKLVAMPQAFRTDNVADQTVNITYTIETCEGGNSSTTTVNTSFDLKEFDKAQDYTNTEANYIASWLPGTHYTYIITIGANAITFNATIQEWATDTGYHYLLQ
ncbi:MAG: fimbrillin family protein [Bacteroidales bacterium]|nr:fimbrillin family protein [Bacteroidales bacterium]